MEITLDGCYTTEVNISIQKIAQSQKNIPKTICPVIPECAMHILHLSHAYCILLGSICMQNTALIIHLFWSMVASAKRVLIK